MQNYLSLLDHILRFGVDRADRTGTGTRSVFGYQIRFDLNAGFPAVTTKKLHFRSIFHELLWFIQGSTNIDYLTQNGVRIWTDWADANGDLGPIYGAQWRSWPSSKGPIDQLSNVIAQLKADPNGRRHIVSAWNPSQLEEMALPPCHLLFQFYLANNRLSCQLYQRSADAFLGVPFNIASYALLTHMIAQVINAEVGEFIHTFGDAHIYTNHFDQVKLQLSRSPLPQATLQLNPARKDIDDFRYEDIKLVGYQSHSRIKAPISV